MRDLTAIKPGDRVWISDGHSGKRDRIQTVVRLTPTQILLDGPGGPDANRYRRTDSTYKAAYRRITSSWWPEAITAIATPEEWDRDQEQKRLAHEAEAQRKDAIEVQRQALAKLLCGRFDCIGASSYVPGAWELTLQVSEAEVREIAALLNRGRQCPTCE